MAAQVEAEARVALLKTAMRANLETSVSALRWRDARAEVREE
jgi:hypothetical protein